MDGFVAYVAAMRIDLFVIVSLVCRSANEERKLLKLSGSVGYHDARSRPSLILCSSCERITIEDSDQHKEATCAGSHVCPAIGPRPGVDLPPRGVGTADP